MKKLYERSSKGTVVHPLFSDYLSSFLPAAMVTLAADLSPADKEVLAYLITCHHHHHNHHHREPNTHMIYKSTPFTTTLPPPHEKEINNNNNKKEHSPVLSCDCFGCYTSYWSRWDTSPNRHIIHHIIDAFELQQQQHQQDNNTTTSKRNKKNKNKNKNKNKRRPRVTPELTRTESLPDPSDSSSIIVSRSSEEEDDVAGGGDEEEKKKGSPAAAVITKFVWTTTFIRHFFCPT